METRPAEMRRRAAELYAKIAGQLLRESSGAVRPTSLSLHESGELGWFVYEWVRPTKGGGKWKARYEIKSADFPAAVSELETLAREIVENWHEAFDKSVPGELF